MYSIWYKYHHDGQWLHYKDFNNYLDMNASLCNLSLILADSAIVRYW